MSFIARGKTHNQKAKLLLPHPLFRHPSEGVGLSASNNLIKKNTQKLTQYFVFSWFQVQSSGQTSIHYTETRIFPTTSVSSGNVSLPSPTYYKCHFLLWMSHTFCLPKVMYTSWSLGIGTFDHHTYVEMTTTVFSTALHGLSLEVPGNGRSVRWRELAMRLQGVFFLPFATIPLCVPSFVGILLF